MRSNYVYGNEVRHTYAISNFVDGGHGPRFSGIQQIERKHGIFKRKKSELHERVHMGLEDIRNNKHSQRSLLREQYEL